VVFYVLQWRAAGLLSNCEANKTFESRRGSEVRSSFTARKVTLMRKGLEEGGLCLSL
jgi:hypothetical protein